MTSGAPVPDWHSDYPSGLSVYSDTAYNSFLITANDATQPADRPRTVTLPAKPTDPESAWATIAQHSLAAGGPFELVNVSVPEHGKGRSACGGGGAVRKEGGYGYGYAGRGDRDKKGEEHHEDQRYSGATGPSGVMHVRFSTATLPTWVGLELNNHFEFFDDCNVHVLRTYFGDVVQTVFFDRLPAHS